MIKRRTQNNSRPSLRRAGSSSSFGSLSTNESRLKLDDEDGSALQFLSQSFLSLTEESVDYLIEESTNDPSCRRTSDASCWASLASVSSLESSLGSLSVGSIETPSLAGSSDLLIKPRCRRRGTSRQNSMSSQASQASSSGSISRRSRRESRSSIVSLRLEDIADEESVRDLSPLGFGDQDSSQHSASTTPTRNSVSSTPTRNSASTTPTRNSACLGNKDNEESTSRSTRRGMNEKCRTSLTMVLGKSWASGSKEQRVRVKPSDLDRNVVEPWQRGCLERAASTLEEICPEKLRKQARVHKHKRKGMLSSARLLRAEDSTQLY
jgi:hypothetical protein